jgi:hypothetical protein
VCIFLWEMATQWHPLPFTILINVWPHAELCAITQEHLLLQNLGSIRSLPFSGEIFTPSAIYRESSVGL